MKFKDAISAAVKMFSSSDFLERIKNEDETMLRHMKILSQINEMGFITIESQAGNTIHGKRDGKPYSISERSFVSGFMLQSQAINFIALMATQTDKNAMYIPVVSENAPLPSALDIPVTVTNRAGMNEITTHFSSAIPQSVWTMFRKQAHINKNEKIVFIFCWDSLWNRDASGSTGLFTDVVKILKVI